MAVVDGQEQPHVMNDTNLLELSRFGESLGSSLFKGANSLKKPLCDLLNGN